MPTFICGRVSTTPGGGLEGLRAARLCKQAGHARGPHGCASVRGARALDDQEQVRGRGVAQVEEEQEGGRGVDRRAWARHLPSHSASGCAPSSPSCCCCCRQWSIQETSATQGKGLHEGFDWLVACINGGGAPPPPPATANAIPATVAAGAPAAAPAASVPAA